MNFSELLSSFFGSDWMNSLVNIATAGAAVVMVVVNKVTKGKLTDVVNNTNINTTTINASLTKALNSIKDLEDKASKLNDVNAELQKQNQVLLEGIAALGNIVSISFLESKAITGEAKLKISTAVADLCKLGIDLTATQEVIEEVENDTKIEEAIEVKEQAEKEAEENIAKAEDTNEVALDLYNKILEDEQ